MLKTYIKDLPKVHKISITSIFSVLVLFILFSSEKPEASIHTEALELSIGERYELPIKVDAEDLTALQSETEQPEWKSIKVRNGDNLAKIFDREGLTPQEVYKVSKAGKDAKKLLKMKPGEELRILKEADNTFSALAYAYSPTETLFINKNSEQKFLSSIEEKQIHTRLGYAQGEIQNSFWNAGVKSGMTEAQIMNLAGIFGWDIDFALEIRKGDNFNVVYEEQFIDGEFIGYGDIVAAEFTNQGEEFTAIRYKDGRYYTPEGRSMRKSFLRAPVSFTRISDNFNPRRFHPVQKRYKPHRGVDYAARRGTPVMAAGDGKVIKAGYDKYNGHHVFLQHGEKYVTKYIHFTKRLVKRGQSVKQGDIIGTVGSTGLASGPHLHYEFLVDGVHRNPRTVKLPKAEPIDKKELASFQNIAQNYLDKLNNNKRIMLAMNSSESSSLASE
ncbi:peptidase M23 [Alteromonadaceae bacterium M269]|nr:peptidase M23 [Alteromonadaceae bacterium M269]